MALFLDVHRLDGREPDAFLRAWADRSDEQIRCLKHWTGRRTIGLLVEAPDWETLHGYDRDAVELTELLAPADRWLSCESIELD